MAREATLGYATGPHCMLHVIIMRARPGEIGLRALLAIASLLFAHDARCHAATEPIRQIFGEVEKGPAAACAPRLVAQGPLPPSPWRRASFSFACGNVGRGARRLVNT